MPNRIRSYYDKFFTSHHTFEENEILLKFQYKVLNTILLVMGFFTFLFATLSLLDINPLGPIQTISNYTLVVISIILIILLRGPKSRYTKITYVMYTSAFFVFLTALLYVPEDEFRIIWFYLLIFAAYITGDIKAGNIVGIFSIVTILIVEYTYGLNMSSLGITTAIIGLIIACLFFRSYTKKIINFEKEIIEQKQFMISQSRFAAMGEMLSMIAHQWRQPLSTTTLLIAQERVKLMMEGDEQNSYTDMLDKISDTLIYLSDTIDDFQTYFKPEKMIQRLEIDTLVHRIEQYAEPRLSMTNIDFVINESDCSYINTYTNELIQSIINIINNAIDVLIEREIVDPSISINLKNSENNLIICIEDNGGGIDDEIIDKIFEPYFSTKSKNGTGLGLYMAKMIIEQHIHGELSIKNTSDGSCFTIVIPKNL